MPGGCWPCKVSSMVWLAIVNHECCREQSGWGSKTWGICSYNANLGKATKAGFDLLFSRSADNSSSAVDGVWHIQSGKTTRQLFISCPIRSVELSVIVSEGRKDHHSVSRGQRWQLRHAKEPAPRRIGAVFYLNAAMRRMPVLVFIQQFDGITGCA